MHFDVVEDPKRPVPALGVHRRTIAGALARAFHRTLGRSRAPACGNGPRRSTSAIAVKDSFYVVPIGVEDECGVVRGVIVRPQTRPSVVDPSCLDGCGVERINRFAVWRSERNVHGTGSCFLFLDPEVSTIVRREAGSLRALDHSDTEGLQRTLVERATLCDVTHAQHHVIKQGRGPTWHQSSIPQQAKARSDAPVLKNVP